MTQNKRYASRYDKLLKFMENLHLRRGRPAISSSCRRERKPDMPRPRRTDSEHAKCSRMYINSGHNMHCYVAAVQTECISNYSARYCNLL